MKIEIAKPERFSQSGKSLLRLIQNNDMPTLDLLVRESIQNSLDAWNKKDKNVLVEFNVGNFDSMKLAGSLEGITEGLNERYGASKQKYISISDSHTFGLTGDVNDPNGEDGNLQKLIYQICRAQEGEGAGGSWGIGKTVYFRVGIGLVIYYSRVKLDENVYEERMAASLVEDETKANALIPKYQDYKKRGVAWWGKQVRENLTVAITDSEEITNILDIFGLEAYTGNKTGTSIIIPYVNEERLLKHNIMEYSDIMGNQILPNWTKTVSSYLKMAIQRWYMPRLNNCHYTYGPYLTVRINDQILGGIDAKDEDIEPLFQLIQALYNRATIGNKEYDDIISDIESHTEDVSIRGCLKDTKSGVVAFTKVDKNTLKMIPPYNKFQPLMYLNKEYALSDVNRPIICYCRRPGMIVSYETVSEWTDGIPSTDGDHYIVGMYVLNSDNNLNPELSGIKLEEYVRQSELADHTSWTDINIKNTNPRIVGRIKKNVANKISKVYTEVEAVEKTSVNSGYSKFFGDMLLPPENFGKAPSPKKKDDKEKKEILQHRDITLSILSDRIKYQGSTIEIPFEIKTRFAVRMLNLNMLIVASDTGGTFDVKQWEENIGADLPFEVQDINLSLAQWEGDKICNDFCHLSEEKQSAGFRAFKCELTKSRVGEIIGMKMECEKAHRFSFKGTLKVLIKRNDYKVTIGATTERGDL